MQSSESPLKGSTLSLSKIDRLSSCSASRLFLPCLILFLFLLRGNVYPNPDPIFSVMSGPAIRRGGASQRNAVSALNRYISGALSSLHLILTSSKHSWSCSHCCISDSPGATHSTNTVSFFRGSPALYSHGAQQPNHPPRCQRSSCLLPLLTNLLHSFFPLTSPFFSLSQSSYTSSSSFTLSASSHFSHSLRALN